jgi:glycyl-tRNA synthetase beta chain
MMTNPTLLVELFTEELPPKALKKLGEAFANGIAQGLIARKLVAADARVTSFATPRRLAVHIESVASLGPEQAKREKVLPVSVALDASGKAQAPLLKKLAAMGLDESAVAKFERAMDGKAEALFHHSVVPGKSLAQALQESLDETLKALPIPKVMFYERDDGTAVNFVRPAHGLIALHGDGVVSISALGLHSGRETKGHRFHSEGKISITHADSYVAQLKHAHVVASFAERRASMELQLKALAKGDEVIAPDALLDEVCSLVEWPKVYECHFETQFLEVPQECLILTMQTNQKYFATRHEGKLTNRFLIVSNIETNDPSLIIGGNERVVRPRLADAKFFFDQDRKKTLESRVSDLYKVVYHNRLGSQGERMERVRAIASSLGRYLEGDDLANKAARAAYLAKADLLTDMVSEFPELQGTMGEYYALNDGESSEIGAAIKEHYLPRFSGDQLPSTSLGMVVALADKLETLAGMFRIGQLPTGDKDPFALRRHAIGVIRLLIACKMPLELNYLLQSIAIAPFKFAENRESMDALEEFIFERFSGYLKEQGYSSQEIESVLSLKPQLLWNVPSRLDAVRDFAKLQEAASLAAANKRITNILKKAEGEVPTSVNTSLLQEEAEKQLHGALLVVAPVAEKLFHNQEYTASLRELAVLRAPVDAFFDKVMVNADDEALRNNRLALLKQLHTAMNRVADLSKLAA